MTVGHGVCENKLQLYIQRWREPRDLLKSFALSLNAGMCKNAAGTRHTNKRHLGILGKQVIVMPGLVGFLG